MKKKLMTAVLTAALTASLLAGCGQSKNEVPSESTQAQTEAASEAVAEDNATEEEVTLRIGAMSGPTAMGMVKMMSDTEAQEAAGSYVFSELATEASALVAPISAGELDIAAVPSNLAANLYTKTEGGVQVIATVNTGVLYVVEKEGSIQQLSDLVGKVVYMTGQGAVPEYTVRYLLTANGIDPDNDLTLQWCADTTEALSYVSQDPAAVAILPQPFVTAACAQVEGLQVALDLNDEWEKLDNGCSIVTGVILARKDVIEKYPNQVAAFVEEYRASVAYTAEDVEGAAALIEKYGIVAKAPIAQKALPGCHLTCLTGAEMKAAVEGFLQTLYDQNPAAVGGAMPGEDFYYGL